jgi:hypothetical protein
MKYFKLNQTVYHYQYGKGVVIDVINNVENFPILVIFKDGKVSFTEDGRNLIDEPIVLSQTPIPEIVNTPIKDTYVPFTYENNLLNMQVITKDKSCKGVITYQDEYKIVIGNYYETYKVLLKDYTFIDGKPCGKLGQIVNY